MCGPTIASSAGSRVTAARTATTTATAAISPIVVTNGMFGHGERDQCDRHCSTSEHHRPTGRSGRAGDRLPRFQTSLQGRGSVASL